MKSVAAFFLAIFFCAGPAATVRAQGDPYYKGKQIKIIVGFTAGGIVDLWARFYIQHLGKQLPGNPELIVQNVPGGGSMIAANQLYNLAKPDGLTLGAFSAGLYFDQLTGAKQVQFDWTKFNWIGSPTQNFETLAMRADSPYRTIEDLQKAAPPPRCGATGVGTTGHVFPKFLEEALGTKIQIVMGYPGTRDIELALERGELQCYAITQEAFSREPGRSWVKKGFLRILVQGGQKRDPSYANVPTIYELMEKHNTPEAIRRVATILLAATAAGRPLAAPPNLPAERLKALRDGYAKMVADGDFLAEAKKRNWDIEYVSGQELEAMAKRAMSQPADTVARLKKILSE